MNSPYFVVRWSDIRIIQQVPWPGQLGSTGAAQSWDTTPITLRYPPKFLIFLSLNCISLFDIRFPFEPNFVLLLLGLPVYNMYSNITILTSICELISFKMLKFWWWKVSPDKSSDTYVHHIIRMVSFQKLSAPGMTQQRASVAGRSVTSWRDMAVSVAVRTQRHSHSLQKRFVFYYEQIIIITY